MVKRSLHADDANCGVFYEKSKKRVLLFIAQIHVPY